MKSLYKLTSLNGRFSLVETTLGTVARGGFTTAEAAMLWASRLELRVEAVEAAAQ